MLNFADGLSENSFHDIVNSRRYAHLVIAVNLGNSHQARKYKGWRNGLRAYAWGCYPNLVFTGFPRTYSI